MLVALGSVPALADFPTWPLILGVEEKVPEWGTFLDFSLGNFSDFSYIYHDPGRKWSQSISLTLILASSTIRKQGTEMNTWH